MPSPHLIGLACELLFPSSKAPKQATPHSKLTYNTTHKVYATQHTLENTALLQSYTNTFLTDRASDLPKTYFNSSCTRRIRIMSSRAWQVGGLALLGGVGYYMYQAGGDPKAAQKRAEGTPQLLCSCRVLNAFVQHANSVSTQPTQPRSRTKYKTSSQALAKRQRRTPK